MNCPECGNESGALLYEDNIKCSCGHELVIGYCLCNNCGFVWRLRDGEYIDGGPVTQGSMDMAIDSIVKALTPQDFCSEGSVLMDALHPCVRCGKTATETDRNNFICVHCGFEWEVQDYVS